MVSTQPGVGFSIMPTNPKKKMCKVYKVVVLGDGNVGKSTLLRRMTDADPLSTNDGVYKDYLSKMATVDDATPVKVQLWDSAGQEKFGSARLPSSFFRHADAALVVYDVTNRQSFVGVLRWVLQIQAYRSTADADSAFSLILVGHKCEFSNEIRQVDEHEGCELAKLIAASHFFQCSSKDSTNIHECFNAVAADLINGTSWALPNVSLPSTRPEPVAKTRGLCKFAAPIPIDVPPLIPDTASITASRSPTLRALSKPDVSIIGVPYMGTLAVLLSMPMILLWLDDDAVLRWAEAVGIQ